MLLQNRSPNCYFALLERSTTLSCSLLWREVMRSPFLQYRAWDMENQAHQHLQCWGKSRGSIWYTRNKAVIHSCAPSSVLLTVYGTTEIHSPVFYLQRIWKAYVTGRDPVVATSDLPASCVFLHRIYTWSSLMRYAWSPYLNYTHP